MDGQKAEAVRKPDVTVDVAVIGSGTAGVVAHTMAKRGGAERVLMIEDGPYGTMCARVGCMPSKALIAAAHAAENIRHAPTFGVHVPCDGEGEVRVDPVAVLERVRAERDRLSGHEVKRIERMPEAEKLRGTARFVAPGRLEVTNREGDEPTVTVVEAKAVVVATGSYQWVPDVLQGLGDRLLDNEALFALPALPKSLAVVGTGVIGMELGQAMHRLGVRTTFLSVLPQIASATDPAVQDKLHALFEAELDMHLPVKVTAARRDGDEVELTWEDADGTSHTGRFERVLAATGRRPRVAELNLEAAGVPLNDKGLPQYDPETMRCGETAVFLAGDVTNAKMLQHEAAAEGRVAGRNAARYPEIERVKPRTGLAIVFTDPQIAQCGQTFAQLTEAGVDFAVGEVDLKNQTRLQVMGENKGLLRLYGDRATKRLLGAELTGPNAEHLAHLITWAIELELTVPRMLALPFYHPVVEEGLRGALAKLNKALKS